MLVSDDDEAIVTAVSHLGRALDLIVVAEGVEDLAVRDYMLARELPIDRLQGYGIARPMPVADLLDWIGERNLSRA
jgi:EAL domain-containing protein (putative c-di-GMP-specific phosphodiesterase class I)